MRLLLAGLCAFAIVPAAGGYVTPGDRWPGPAVTVWNATGYEKPVADAVRAWNAAGADIQLVPVGTRGEADLVVTYRKSGKRGGASTVGYAERAGSTMLPRGLAPPVATGGAAHELGHVLGLGHETRGCALMAPVVNAGKGSRCGIGSCKAIWRCLLRSDDEKGVRALYGLRSPS